MRSIRLRFVDLVRNFGDDDVFAVLADFFDGGFGAHDETAAARFDRRLRCLRGRRCTAGREIRAGNELHHFFQRGVGLFDQQDGGIDDFAQVVRRNVGGHADGDTAGAVDEEIRNPRGQNDRLFARLVEVRDEIDGFFFEVGENFFGDFRQARFGVPHGRRGIAVDGAEVSLAVDQRVAHVEVLREAHERGVDDGFTVRVIVAGGVAADLGALAVAAIGSEAEVVHGRRGCAAARASGRRARRAARAR